VERREAHKRFLSSGEGRGARARSRAAFRGLAGAAARRAGREAFPEVLGPRPVGGLPLAARQRLVGYVGEMAALVDRPGGGPPALVESTLPLRAAAEGEDAQPIDLTLDREGEGYVPRRVPVGVRFPSRLGDGISLPGAGVRVTPAGGGDGEGTSVDGRLWWQNVATDTDFSVVPRFDGFETAHVLRSSDSPQELRLGLDLPAGDAPTL